jgi:hypothetical protein
MLPSWIILLTTPAGLLFTFRYINLVKNGLVYPNFVTWLIWTINGFLVFLSALSAGVNFIDTFIYLMSGISPGIVLISLIWLKQKKISFSILDLVCLTIAFIGIIAWKTTDNPIYGLFFGIFADGVGAIPTVIKSWKDPASEYLWSYVVWFFNGILGLLILKEYSISSIAFPIYLILIYGIISWPIALYKKNYPKK